MLGYSSIEQSREGLKKYANGTVRELANALKQNIALLANDALPGAEQPKSSTPDSDADGLLETIEQFGRFYVELINRRTALQAELDALIAKNNQNNLSSSTVKPH